jgi:hypothetical protein
MLDTRAERAAIQVLALNARPSGFLRMDGGAACSRGYLFLIDSSQPEYGSSCENAANRLSEGRV